MKGNRFAQKLRFVSGLLSEASLDVVGIQSAPHRPPSPRSSIWKVINMCQNSLLNPGPRVGVVCEPDPGPDRNVHTSTRLTLCHGVPSRLSELFNQNLRKSLIIDVYRRISNLRFRSQRVSHRASNRAWSVLREGRSPALLKTTPNLRSNTRPTFFAGHSVVEKTAGRSIHAP